MKPLEMNRRVLTWLCVYPASENTSKSTKTLYVIFTLIILSGNLIGLGLSIDYFLKSASTDLEDSLYALFQILATAKMSYTMIVAYFLRHRITAIFVSLSDIYDASKNL